jgi:hypothetical protein
MAQVWESALPGEEDESTDSTSTLARNQKGYRKLRARARVVVKGVAIPGELGEQLISQAVIVRDRRAHLRLSALA